MVVRPTERFHKNWKHSFELTPTLRPDSEFSNYFLFILWFAKKIKVDRESDFLAKTCSKFLTWFGPICCDTKPFGPGKEWSFVSLQILECIGMAKKIRPLVVPGPKGSNVILRQIMRVRERVRHGHITVKYLVIFGFMVRMRLFVWRVTRRNTPSVQFALELVKRLAGIHPSIDKFEVSSAR